MPRISGLRPFNNKQYLAACSFWFLLTLAPVRLFPQEVGISIHPVKNSYSIRLSVNNMKSEEILKSLSEGLRAEINYHIRIYQKAGGIFKFLGDKLIEESSPTIIARWDMFRRQYIVEDDLGNVTYCATADDFLNAFFHSSAYTVTSELSDPDFYYVLAQSNIRAMKIVPPFTILSSIFPLGAITTSWARQELKKVAGVQE